MQGPVGAKINLQTREYLFHLVKENLLMGLKFLTRNLQAKIICISFEIKNKIF